jgi:hypothetical protein
LYYITKSERNTQIIEDFWTSPDVSTESTLMPSLLKLLQDIGHAGCTLFSTLNLTQDHWRQQLKRGVQSGSVHPEGRPPNTISMGVLGATTSFQQQMETITEDLPQVTISFDNLLVHSETHHDHLKHLETVL